MSKRKVFLSYYHNDDEVYKNRFQALFGDYIISKSVEPGDIESDLSDEYIKQLIQKGYLKDTSVLIVLIGPKTYCRKHVDWEISAAISKKVGSYSGLLGLCLPHHSAYQKDNYKRKTVPARFADNHNSGYALFYDWTTNTQTILNRIDEAFEKRKSHKDLIDNNRKQLQSNLCR